jgi:hypothetical protein
MGWLTVVLQGIGAIVSEWFAASDEERAAIEKRAIDAIEQMIDAGRVGDQAHANRTLETVQAIAAARAAQAPAT